MKMLANSRRYLLALCLMLTMIFSVSAWASSDDNSLYDLGITTEGVTVEPEFSYSTWEYDVVVPAGTTALELSPVASSEQASITEVSGTSLDSEGNATVLITVTSGSGIPFTYTLHVTSELLPAAETEVQTEAQTEPATEAQTEAQTEDSQYVKVDRNTIQEAENTITDLKGEINELRETLSLYTRIIYALIGVCIVFFFIIINQMLRKKDLKAELNDYRSYGYTPDEKPSRSQAKAQKKQSKQPKKSKQGNSRSQFSQQAEEVEYTDYFDDMDQAENTVDAGARRASYYQPDQDLDVTPQLSRKARNMPTYEEENVVRQAAAQSKSEDDARREAQAAKRQESRTQAQADKASKAASQQADKQRRAAAKEEASRAKQEQKQAKKRRGSDNDQSSDGGVKIDMIDL